MNKINLNTFKILINILNVYDNAIVMFINFILYL